MSSLINYPVFIHIPLAINRLGKEYGKQKEVLVALSSLLLCRYQDIVNRSTHILNEYRSNQETINTYIDIYLNLLRQYATDDMDIQPLPNPVSEKPKEEDLYVSTLCTRLSLFPPR